MLSFRYFISAILFTTLFGCDTKRTEIKIEDQGTIKLHIQDPDNYLLGEWTAQSTIWDKSKLTLNKDKTFSYSSYSCLGESFSEGSWSSTFNGIILISDGKYKQKDEKISVGFPFYDTLYFDRVLLMYRDGMLYNYNSHMISSNVLHHKSARVKKVF